MYISTPSMVKYTYCYQKARVFQAEDEIKVNNTMELMEIRNRFDKWKECRDKLVRFQWEYFEEN